MAAAGPAKTQAADIPVCLNFLTRSQTVILVCGMLALGDENSWSQLANLLGKARAAASDPAGSVTPVGRRLQMFHTFCHSSSRSYFSRPARLDVKRKRSPKTAARREQDDPVPSWSPHTELFSHC